MKEIRPTITQSPDDLARPWLLGWTGFESMSPNQQMRALPTWPNQEAEKCC